MKKFLLCLLVLIVTSLSGFAQNLYDVKDSAVSKMIYSGMSLTTVKDSLIIGLGGRAFNHDLEGCVVDLKNKVVTSISYFFKDPDSYYSFLYILNDDVNLYVDESEGGTVIFKSKTSKLKVYLFKASSLMSASLRISI